MKFFAFAAVGLAIFATPALAVDGCLIGHWEADKEEMVDLLTLSGMPGVANYLGGRVTMNIDGSDFIRTEIDNLTLEIIPEGALLMVMRMTGFNEGDIQSIEGEAFIIQIDDFLLSSEVTVMGERMTFPVDPGNAPLGHAAGGYTCDDRQVIFEEAPSADDVMRMPRTWTRVPS